MGEEPYDEMDVALRFLESKERIIIFLNPAIENFQNSFSKMEMITAMDYINSLSGRTRFIAIGIDYDPQVTAHVQAFIKSRIALPHRQESTSFVEAFAKHSSSFECVGRENTAKGLLQKAAGLCIRGEPVYIGGFYTETDVLMFCSTVFLSGFLPVIISDLCSSPSERAHFSALEVASRFSKIMDTRDIQRVNRNEN